MELPLVITISRPGTRGRTPPIPAGKVPHSVPVLDQIQDDLVITTIRYPRYIGRLMDEWILAYPGHTKASLILNGLVGLGLPIKAADLIPQRVRGGR